MVTTPAELTAVHLKYSSGAQPLLARAISQVAAKALYARPTGQESATKEQIQEDIVTLCGAGGLKMSVVKQGLKFLAQEGIVDKTGRQWRLTEKGYQKIEQALDRSRANVQYILETYFPHYIDQALLRAWFVDATSSFLAQFANYWARSLCRLPVAPKALSSTRSAEVLGQTIKTHGLQENAVPLVAGFQSFIEGTDHRVQEHLAVLGHSLFAARLIAAAIGADPIAVAQIRATDVLVDTNILFAAVLDDNEDAKNVESLGRAIGRLELRLSVLPDTLEEFRRVVNAKKEQAERVAQVTPWSVVSKAHDSFTRAAIRNGISNPDEFQRFFDHLATWNPSIAGVPITTCEDDVILQAAKRGSSDMRLRREVASATGRREDRLTVEHDAALMSAVEEARRQGQNDWVLTGDWTMTSFAAKRTAPTELPTWLPLATLVQMLALDEDGTEEEAQAYGALLANLIANEAQPMMGTFEVEDLYWLLQIEEHCLLLPEEKLIECAARVARARFLSTSVEDPGLKLELQRIYEGAHLASDQQLDQMESGLSDLRQDVREKTQRIEVLEGEARNGLSAIDTIRQALVVSRTSQLRRDAQLLFVAQVFGALMWTALFVGGALTANLVGSGLLLDFGVPVLLFGIGTASAIGFLWKSWRRMMKRLKSARVEAENQAA